MGWIRTSLRRLREERATALALAVLMLVTAFVAGAAPRVLAGVARDALRSEVAQARVPARNVQLIEERRVRADERGPFLGVETLGERREEQIPNSVRGLFVDRAYVVDTPRWSVISDTLPRSTVAFRFQPGAEERIRFIDGRLPSGATRTIEVPALLQPSSSRASASAAGDAPAHGIRGRAADRIGRHPAGRRRRHDRAQIDATDRLARGHEDRAAIEIVGTYEVTNPADLFWLDDQSLARPTVREIFVGERLFDATAFLSSEAYPALMDVTEESRCRCRTRGVSTSTRSASTPTRSTRCWWTCAGSETLFRHHWRRRPSRRPAADGFGADRRHAAGPLAIRRGTAGRRRGRAGSRRGQPLRSSHPSPRSAAARHSPYGGSRRVVRPRRRDDAGRGDALALPAAAIAAGASFAFLPVGRPEPTAIAVVRWSRSQSSCCSPRSCGPRRRRRSDGRATPRSFDGSAPAGSRSRRSSSAWRPSAPTCSASAACGSWAAPARSARRTR
jgi:hypothetical protein